jgi:hypothetical protein
MMQQLYEFAVSARRFIEPVWDDLAGVPRPGVRGVTFGARGRPAAELR